MFFLLFWHDLVCKDEISTALKFLDLCPAAAAEWNFQLCNMLQWFSCCLCQDDECYEQTADVRSQLRFFEQLERIEKQRKDEQEREILLKAAKVSYCHFILVCELLCSSVCVCVCTHWCCKVSNSWVTVWHDLMKWPPCVLRGFWPPRLLCPWLFLSGHTNGWEEISYSLHHGHHATYIMQNISLWK